MSEEVEEFTLSCRVGTDGIKLDMTYPETVSAFGGGCDRATAEQICTDALDALERFLGQRIPFEPKTSA